RSDDGERVARDPPRANARREDNAFPRRAAARFARILDPAREPPLSCAEFPRDGSRPPSRSIHASTEGAALSAPSPPVSGSSRAAFAFAALALLALRVPHLTGELTDPHAWRQCDTVHFALDFYRRGFDLLHPAVCWLGAHRTILLNFPLSEAITALLYRA